LPPPRRKSYGIAKRKPTRAGLFILAGSQKGCQMLRLIFGLFFIALPFLEIALLIKSGQVLGFWPTLAMVLGAGVAGAAVWSRQGLSVARKTQYALAQGRPPVGPVLDGAFLLLAGALLIAPGFLTDAMALLLLIPPVRHRIMRWAVRRVVERAHVQVRTFDAGSDTGSRREPGRPSPGGGPAQGAAKGPVIEGEFERLGEKTRTPHRDPD
jgi:UPF0716 protein FxsA